MTMKSLSAALLAMAVIGTTAPAFAYDPHTPQQSRHRKSKQDEWKNIGIASGAAALLGLLTKNGTVTTLGTVGALYSAYRYEEDRKSGNREARARADLYSRRYVNMDGHRYKRKTVYRHGRKYYQFVRG